MLHPNSPWVCVIMGKIITKDNLNIANLMQIFEHFILQHYSTEFWDIVTVP